MTPFLFTMTYYMKMTQETTRTRESIVLELVSKNSLFSLTAQPPVTQGVTAEGRESSRQATGLLEFNRIGMTWLHQVYLLTTLLPSAHRDLRDLCYTR